MSVLTFTRSNTGLIGISKLIEETLLGFRQLSDCSKEAGGMLFGRLIDGTPDIVIDKISVPSPLDKSSRYSFFRRKQPAQIIVNSLWAASDQTCVYLGEWHTHPEDEPSPSQTDIDNWHKIVRKAKYEQDCLLFLIAGRKKVRIWELDRNAAQPKECLEFTRNN